MSILVVFLLFIGASSYADKSTPDLPDLIIELVTWSPQFPVVDDDYERIRFKITVRNIGAARASKFAICVAVGDMHVATNWVQFLPPGKCFTVETKSKLTRNPGSYPVAVKVDGYADSHLKKMKMPMNNMVAESDENNNMLHDSITCIPKGTAPPAGQTPFPSHNCSDSLDPELPPKPKLMGYVRSSVSGQIVSEAQVALGMSTKATTDKTGKYIFKTLNFNPGAITITATGYHLFRKSSPNISPDPLQIDFYIHPLGSETAIDVGGVNFIYFDDSIKRFLETTNKAGKIEQRGSYKVGEYKGEGFSFGYSVTLYARNHAYYYTNRMNKEYSDAAKTSLKYGGVSYAPVRVHKNINGQDTTLGHFFIDQQGNILTNEDAIEGLFTAIHALGEQNSHAYIDSSIQDFKDLRQELYDKRSKYSEIVGWGIALRALDDTFAIATGMASGDIMGVSGAVFAFADSVAFYNKLINMRKAAADPNKTFPDLESLNKYVIGPLKTSHTTIGSVADLWPVAKAFVWKQKPHDFLDDMFMSMSWNSAWKETLKANKGKIGMSIASQVGELIKLIENPDEMTENAMGWEIQTCGLIAMVNKVIKVLGNSKDGVGSLQEAQQLRNLKYNCAQIAYSYGKLTQAVYQIIEHRKKSTISGWLYSRFKPVWNKVIFKGTLPSGSELEIVQEIAKLLSGYEDSSGNFVKGSAQCMAEAFFDDFRLTGLQKAWTMARIKEKKGIL